MGKPVYIGLDLETDGIDIDAGTVPIQIGVSSGMGPGANYSSLIGWPLDNTLGWPPIDSWSESSEAVHGIPIERVRGAYSDGLTSWDVDNTVFEWMTASGIGPHSAVLVGWNVGTFDFPFVRRYLPRVATLCSYRFADLNALCFSIALAGKRRANKSDQALGFETWKKRAKAAAAEMMGGTPRWHDAGYDATASLLQWWWLVDRLNPAEGV